MRASRDSLHGWTLPSRPIPGSPTSTSRRSRCTSTWPRASRSSRAPSARSRRCSPTERRRSEEHTSELQSLAYLVCRLLLEKKKTTQYTCLYHRRAHTHYPQEAPPATKVLAPSFPPATPAAPARTCISADVR